LVDQIGQPVWETKKNNSYLQLKKIKYEENMTPQKKDGLSPIFSQKLTSCRGK